MAQYGVLIWNRPAAWALKVVVYWDVDVSSYIYFFGSSFHFSFRETGLQSFLLAYNMFDLDGYWISKVFLSYYSYVIS